MTLTKQQHGIVIKNLGYLKWSMFSLNTTTKLIRKPELQKQHTFATFVWLVMVKEKHVFYLAYAFLQFSSKETIFRKLQLLSHILVLQGTIGKLDLFRSLTKL